MPYHQLGIHEKVELHELLTMKTVCAGKAMVMKDMVNDTQLRSLLEQDVTKSKEHIRELQNLLTDKPTAFQ